MKNLEEKIYLLADLGLPKMEAKRLKWRNSEIKVLYQLYLGHKNLKRGAWKDISPERKTIGKWSHVSEASVRNFVCAPYFSLFGDKCERWIKGKQTSNQYRLKEWVFELFEFFERLGMMREFQTDFDAWRRTFRKRIFKYVIPRIQQGLSLSDILDKKRVANKLSTKHPLKLPAADPLKLPATTPSGFTTPSGSRSNTERLDPLFSGFLDSFETLRNRFQIEEGDLRWLMRNVPLKEIDKGIRVEEQWLKNGMAIRSPIKTFMAAMR